MPTNRDSSLDDENSRFIESENLEQIASLALEKRIKLDNFFDLSKYPIIENDFLHKKKDLYQIEDTDIVIQRAELKAQLVEIKRRLLEDSDLNLSEKQKLEAEKESFQKKVSNLQVQSTGTMQGYAELATRKKNRLRTNWVNYVLGEVQIIADIFSKENIAGQYHFEDLQAVVLAFKAKMDEYLVREAQLKSALTGLQEIDQTKAKQDLALLESELKNVYSAKKDFILQGMNSLHFVATQMLEVLRNDIEQGEIRRKFTSGNLNLDSVFDIINNHEPQAIIEQVRAMLLADYDNANWRKFINIYLNSLDLSDSTAVQKKINSLLNILTVVTYADEKKQKAN